MVGAVRFELTTSCTRNKRATRLRYAPTREEKMPTEEAKSNPQFRSTARQGSVSQANPHDGSCEFLESRMDADGREWRWVAPAVHQPV